MAKRKSKKSFGGAATLCVALAILMGIAVFVMMFFANIIETNSQATIEFKELFFGKESLSSSLGKITVTGTLWGFVAYVLTFVAAFMLVLTMLSKKLKYRKLVCFVSGLLMIACGVVILMIPQLYAGAKNVVELGNSTSFVDKVGTYALSTTTLISGIIALVGGVLSLFSLVANKLFK